jgi:aminocarboxymuconate-semialdehyde decarboxylase
VAGKMLCSDDKLSNFLTWDERAHMLAGNAIELFNLGPLFKKGFQRKLAAFKQEASNGAEKM